MPPTLQSSWTLRCSNCLLPFMCCSFSFPRLKLVLPSAQGPQRPHSSSCSGPHPPQAAPPQPITFIISILIVPALSGFHLRRRMYLTNRERTHENYKHHVKDITHNSDAKYTNDMITWLCISHFHEPFPKEPEWITCFETKGTEEEGSWGPNSTGLG